MHLRRLVLALAALTFLAPDTLTAQSPKWFVTAGTGVQWSGYLVDDASNSAWDFDAGFGFRAAIERQFSPQVAAGVAFNRARLPLTYTSFVSSSSCGRCAADATIASYGATARLGGGPGFHQVLELFVGAQRYGNFTQTQGGASLPPTSNTDFAFGAGVGFGYSVARDWQVLLMQDAVNAIHERSTQSQAGGRVSRHFMTRLALRVGF